MDNRERGSEWGVVAALGLIAIGVWYFLGNVLGPWWQESLRYAFGFLWPLALIVAGVLLWLSASRGSLPRTGGTRLYRSRKDRVVSGVLGGLAHNLGIDPTIVRAAFVVLALLTRIGPAVIAYIIASVIIPEEPVEQQAVTVPGQQVATERVPPVPPAPPVPQPPVPPVPPVSSVQQPSAPPATRPQVPPVSQPVVPPPVPPTWPHEPTHDEPSES